MPKLRQLSSLRITLFASLLFCSFAVGARAQWTHVHDFPSAINSIWFKDANVGFVGLGIVPGAGQVDMKIFRTTDGGTTWTDCIVPNGTGSVTKVIMTSDLVGFASAQPWPFSISGALWKTTDGGLTWKEIGGSTLLGSDIGITPTTMIMTDLFGAGLMSTDQGVTWTRATDHNVGISYVDDVHGVMTRYKKAGNWVFTDDGGRSWAESKFGDEGWGVWGRPGTSTFFAAPEMSSDYVTYNSPVMTSTDYGETWTNVVNLPFRTTGTLIGAGDDLYVQAMANGLPRGYGLYHSSDDGHTWTSIGGPSAINDTRAFVMRGCGSNTIWVPDSVGGLWRFGASATSRYVSSTPDTARTYGFGDTVSVRLNPVLPANTSLPMTALTVTIDAEFDPVILEPQLTKTTANAGWTLGTTTQDSNHVIASFTSKSRSITSRSFSPGTLYFKPVNLGSVTVRLKEMTIETDQSPLVYCGNEEGNSLASITIEQSAGVATATDISYTLGRLDARTFRFDPSRISDLQVFDLLGRECREFISTGDRLTLSTPPGVYFISYTANGQHRTTRVVVPK
jgi:photosystem II stability/assembly factor-like uncharacterized protein